MAKIQIKVIKTVVLDEMQKYVKPRIEKCPVFTEGQLFETEYEKPNGFCDWAWNDIHPYVASLMTGGNFSEGMFSNWMNDKNTIIACCTDGVRPVIFEIRRVEE
jgi:uncharacterized repeat protein (TIGR04076 family)